MSFWDRFVITVYLTFQVHTARGLAAAADIFGWLDSRVRLNPSSLHDVSILLLVATCPRGSTLRVLVDQQFLARNLQLPASVLTIRDLLRRMAPFRDREAVALYHSGNGVQRGQVAEILCRDYGPRVRDFLGHLYLLPPTNFFQSSRRIVANALGGFALIPLNTIDFASYLFGRVPRNFGNMSPPSHLPDPAPAGFTALLPDEQAILRSCYANLDASERILLYFSLYARLDIHQLTQLLGLTGHWTEDEVLDHLTSCWNRVL